MTATENAEPSAVDRPHRESFASVSYHLYDIHPDVTMTMAGARPLAHVTFGEGGMGLRVVTTDEAVLRAAAAAFVDAADRLAAANALHPQAVAS